MRNGCRLRSWRSLNPRFDRCCMRAASSVTGTRLRRASCDSRRGWEQGGESGPAIAPGKPEASLLIKAVQYADKDLKMPPEKLLSAEEVSLLVEWVRQGALDPRLGARAASAQPESNDWAEEFQRRLDWWSLKPLATPEPPVVAEERWSRRPVDRFIHAGLSAAGLQPAHVNRVWQWVFGTGLVTTPDDFGRLGDKPSNPELLDWLARDFMRQGWSTKQLVRQLILSATFRQSGVVSEAARQRDPANRRLHHYPTRRLEAEAIRDAMLAVSGRLDAKLYGCPLNPSRPAEDAAKRLFSGPLDGDGRRSLYLTMSIMVPPEVPHDL